MTKARKPALLETDGRGATGVGGGGGTRTAHGTISPTEEKTDRWVGIFKKYKKLKGMIGGDGEGFEIADPISPACYKLEKYGCLGQNKLYFWTKTLGVKTVIPVRTYNHLQCQTVPNSYECRGQMGDTRVCFYGTCW
jgi:hypothetical protein